MLIYPKYLSLGRLCDVQNKGHDVQLVNIGCYKGELEH